MRKLIRPLGLVIVAAVGGFLIAREVHPGGSHDSGALSRRASAPTFTFRFPDDWRSADPPSLSGLRLSGAVVVGPGGGGANAHRRMSVGTARVPTVGSLPGTFTRSLRVRPRPETVALGAYRFDRYLNLRPRGSGEVVSVYLLATTHSTVVATCASPTVDQAFTVQCESVLRTMTLAHGVAVSGQVDAAYALELNGILASLSQARRADGPGLEAASLVTRAQSALRLAGAEDAAATTAQRLSAGSATTANDQLVSSLREAGDGYRALAAAARRSDRSAYEAAQHTLQRAQQRLTAAFRTLARLGYELR